MDATNPLYDSLRFADNTNVRKSFIALFTFWIIWALLLLADHGMGFVGHDDAPATNTTATTKRFTGSRSNVTRAQKVARNLFITMLWMLTASTLGLGLTRGSMILTWIYFAIGVTWVAVDLVIANGIVDSVFSLVEFALALTVMSIGFSKGW
ncbi:hypothetical protein K7432_010578 [Basidiobolus ranarum]|uniref:Uncharacterized protein n=1 Tax=Basidiobolus ranarum TaxID=34480 RepID=A0ABR2VV94_9FUNG